MVNVGHSTIAKAQKIATDAPELATKVRSGEMRLDAAYKHVMGKGPGRKSHIGDGREGSQRAPMRGDEAGSE
jgi:hypothetical protein